MSVISETTRIVVKNEATTIFTATSDCTVSVELVNLSQLDTHVWMLYTSTPTNTDSGHVMEVSTFVAPGGVMLRNGMPVKSGWSFVIKASSESETVNLSALISGFTVEA